ncbi:hypothetical protein INR49_019945 [Caranx melampygus]|nr:hypothetical protein INR49_019945 [Caranx melampygus]
MKKKKKRGRARDLAALRDGGEQKVCLGRRYFDGGRTVKRNERNLCPQLWIACTSLSAQLSCKMHSQK